MSSSSPTKFSRGFEPLIVTEGILDPRKCENLTKVESDEEESGSSSTPTGNSSDSSESDETVGNSDSTEHYTVTGFMRLNVGNIEGSTITSVPVITKGQEMAKFKSTNLLQKMSSIDFGKTFENGLQNEQKEQEPKIMAATGGNTFSESRTHEALPPISPPTSTISSGIRTEYPKPPTQNVRTQAGVSKLKSPARQISYNPPPEPKSWEDKVRPRKYAASLPDRERRLSSPFDLSIFQTDQSEFPPSGNHKHLWPRRSAERDLIGPPPSIVHQSVSSNRHSSYHPAMSLVDEAATAAADAVVHKLNKIILSRPPSPVLLPRATNRVGVCCCDGTKTLPRATHACSGCSHAQSLPHCVSSGSRGSLMGLDVEDRLLRLESDKDSLHVQVSVLSDQIDLQTSKIHDLERVLDDKKCMLDSTQDTLSRELLTRSTLETQKLELMTEISSLRLKQATLERENLDLRDRFGGTDLDGLRVWAKPPSGPVVGHMRSPSPTLRHPVQNGYAENGYRSRLGSGGNSIPVKPLSRPRTPPANAYRRIENQATFGTLPRRNVTSQLSAFNNGLPMDNYGPPRNGDSPHVQKFLQGCFLNSPQMDPQPSFQLALKPFFHRQQLANFQEQAYGASGLGLNSETENGSRSTSAPNLAGEREEWERRSGKPKSPGPTNRKSRGILRILSKLRRSNSCGPENDESSHFKRGGFRLTATPRLGWTSEPIPLKKPDGPPHLWDSDGVVLWLNSLGLGIYSREVKRWVKSGQQLLEASSKELEKELGVKNPLHRKKLNLAIYSLRNNDEDDSPGNLDSPWVIGWLDDIGLPQYKEAFEEARVDGRVLNQLTAEDLTFLKVTSLLHHLSIKRGIQLLRIHKFHPSCLCRRSVSRGAEECSWPDHVATWSNHRVMEWLRSVELAEYAPNLRGSGVHGGLLILEPRFNADLLATLLSIPPDKTLLRRHLSQEVAELVSREIVLEKRRMEISPEFIPLTPTLKVKTGKPISKVFNLRKKRNGLGNDDLLCPMEMNFFPFLLSSQLTEKSTAAGSLLNGTNEDKNGNN